MAVSMQLETVGTRILAPSSGMTSRLESSIKHGSFLQKLHFPRCLAAAAPPTVSPGPPIGEQHTGFTSCLCCWGSGEKEMTRGHVTGSTRVAENTARLGSQTHDVCHVLKHSVYSLDSYRIFTHRAHPQSTQQQRMFDMSAFIFHERLL